MEHNCELMLECLQDQRVQIKYNACFREYFIPLLYKAELVAKQCIDYCPWCGKSLPQSLRELYYETLEKEYDIDDPDDVSQRKRIPKEFTSDAWWKKRGL